MPLFDLGVAWDGLDPTDQREVGIAALAMAIGIMAEARLGGEQPGHVAAFAAGIETIDGILTTGGARTLTGWTSEAKEIPTPDAWRFMIEELDL